MAWFKVTKEGNLKDGDLAKIKVNGIEVLIIKDNGKYYATSHLCTHEDYDLADGFLDDHQLICPNHFATFDPKDGKVISPPEGAGDISPLKSYITKIENGDVMVDIE
jgi:nitrite reductase/ring-hydroxylating ferredoxin subunit